MPGHIIVCGEDALAIRIINELGDADIRTLQSPTGLADAESHSALAIICASDEDSLNLEMALLARRANADVRVVARIGNPVLRQALNGDDGPEFADNDENSFHVVTIIGTVVFDGFTVTGGNADGDYTVDPGGKAGKGGGVHCRGPGSPTLCNCTISGNSATAYYGWGGGMHITNHSRPALTDCTFRDNKGGAGGGLNGAALAFTNCTFIRNTASFHGGGMCLDGQPTLTNCTFSHNSSEGDGGGIFCTKSSPTLIDCTFTRNLAA